MRKTVSALLVSTLMLSACQSRINPFNWFGDSSPEIIPSGPTEPSNPLIPAGSGLFSSKAEEVYTGQPVDTVNSLIVERVPGGAIIRATGVAAFQGIFDVQLTPENADELPVDGVLTYRLEGKRGSASTAPSAEATREVVAARKLTDQMLAGVRTIRVEAVRNAQVTHR